MNSSGQHGSPPTPPPRDAFAVLGLPRRFDLAPADVQRAYLAKVTQAHPDAIGAEMLEGLDDAAGHTADLNRAKSVLESDESRANLLLGLLGGPTKEADKSLPEGFLMEVMDVREQVEAALASNDPSQRAKWKHWAMDQRRAYVTGAQAFFERMLSQTDAPSEQSRRELRRHLNAWRYIERMIEQLDETYNPSKADFKE
jgi:molecular chaperone HscB